MNNLLQELPNMLFKYRFWSDAPKKIVQKTILTNNEIYFASPSDFNDIRECRLPIRFDLVTHEMLFDYLYFRSKNKNPNQDESYHKKVADDWVQKSPIWDKNHQSKEEGESYKELCEIFGVFSASTVPDNANLWNAFADKHKGFCVGFDTNILTEYRSNFYGSSGYVNYYNEGEEPIILPFYKTDEERIKAMIQNIFWLRIKFLDSRSKCNC